MRKLKAIWRLIWAREWFVYTSRTFGFCEIEHEIDAYDLGTIEMTVNDLIEAEESLQYTKSLLAEI